MCAEAMNHPKNCSGTLRGWGKDDHDPHLALSDLEDLRMAFTEGGPFGDSCIRAALHSISCKRCRELLYTYVLGARLEESVSAREEAEALMAALKAVKRASLLLERGKNGVRLVSSSGLTPGGLRKGLPRGFPVAAVSEILLTGESGPSGFDLSLRDRGRSMTLTFHSDPGADVDAGNFVSVHRNGPGRFTMEVGAGVELSVTYGSGERSTLTVAAEDVAEITDAPALLAIYADAVFMLRPGDSKRRLDRLRADSLFAAGEENSGFFAAALDSLTLSAAPLVLQMAAPGPSPEQRRQWKEILESLALAIYLDEISALPCFAPETGELARVFELVTDGLVNTAQRRLACLLSRIPWPDDGSGPSAQAQIYLAALNGWLLVCRGKHDSALEYFGKVFIFHRRFPGANLSPFAKSAHYFADIGGRTAELLIRQPNTPFRQAVFHSVAACLA